MAIRSSPCSGNKGDNLQGLEYSHWYSTGCVLLRHICSLICLIQQITSGHIRGGSAGWLALFKRTLSKNIFIWIFFPQYLNTPSGGTESSVPSIKLFFLFLFFFTFYLLANKKTWYFACIFLYIMHRWFISVGWGSEQTSSDIKWRALHSSGKTDHNMKWRRVWVRGGKTSQKVCLFLLGFIIWSFQLN